MTINYNKEALLHTYQKHGLNKSKIQEALDSGVYSIVEDYKTNSYVIFTNNNIAIAVDHKYNLKTAFEPHANYYRNMIAHGRAKIVK